MTDSVSLPTVPITSVPRTAMAVLPARTRMLRGLALAIFPDTNRKAPFLITTPSPPALVRGSKTNSSRTRRASSPIEKVVPSRSRICARTPSPVTISSSKNTLLPTARARMALSSVPMGPAATGPFAAARTPETGRSDPPAITGTIIPPSTASPVSIAAMSVDARPHLSVLQIMLENRFQPDRRFRSFAAVVRDVGFRAGR